MRWLCFSSRSIQSSLRSRLSCCKPTIFRLGLHSMTDNGNGRQIEEQTLPRYFEKRYYPVRIGEVLVDRFRILAKLGYGAYSTVWLARDERTAQYASLKVCVQDDSDASPVSNEIKMLRRLGKCAQSSPGSAYVRLADEILELDGPSGRHYCIVSKPQNCSLWKVQHMFPHAKMPKEFVIDIIQRLIGCINWLYVDCDVIHTEITTQNVLMRASSDAIFDRIEEEESRDPSVPIEDNMYPVYRSRGEPSSIFELSGDPLLTDFGSMQMADTVHRGWWMPDTYRAPEVLLGLPWDCQVDIWSVGIMTLELLEGRNVFNPIDTVHQQYVLPLALAQYIGYMGLPPLWMIQQSENPVIRTFFDEKGQWIADIDIPSTSLDDFITSIPSSKEKEKCIKFLRRIMTWDPAARALSHELFSDPWFK